MSQLPQPEIQHSAELLVSARTIEDDQGESRRLYELAPGVTLSFRDRDEFPTFSHDLGTDVPTIVLTDDEQPHAPDAASSAQDYVERHRAPSTLDGPRHYVANATPVGLIDLVNRLKLDRGEEADPKLTAMRQRFTASQVGDQENSLLDMMAASIIYDDGDANFRDKTVEAEQSDGLLTVVKALDGDTDAQTALHGRMETLETLERKFTTRKLGADAVQHSLEQAMAPMQPETIARAKGLVLVRSTSNELLHDPTGNIILKSAAEHTRGIAEQDGQYVPRGTVHFTLNHRVVSHMGGKFDGSDTIVAPLDKALEANGRPVNLAAIDTFFAAGPGEGVVLPDAVTVRPGGDQTELVVEDHGNKTFKSEGYTPDDAARIMEALTNGEFGLPLSNNGASEQLKDRLLALTKDRQSSSLGSEITVDVYDNAGRHEQLLKVVDTASAQSMKFEELVLALHTLRQTAGETDDQAAERFNATMATFVKDLTVDGTITQMDGKVVESEAESKYILTPGFDENVRGLADEIGATSGLHVNTAAHRVEKAALKMLYGSDGRENINPWLSSSSIPTALRRLLINDGLLTVRQIDPNDIARYNPGVPRFDAF